MEMLTSLVTLVVTGYLKEDRIIPRMYHTVSQCVVVLLLTSPSVAGYWEGRQRQKAHSPGRSSSCHEVEVERASLGTNLEQVKFAKENVKVYVGDIHVSKLMKSPSLAIASLHVHPGYKNNDLRTNFDNDIALIKLKSSITFNMNVMPVCLPQRDTKLNSTGLVSGFGLTEDLHTANKLGYISLPVVEQDECHRSIETERKNRHDVAPLTDNMFCAGLPEGGKDTCSGDSGSAFVMKDEDTYWVAGIVSWGVDCGQPGKYGIYTRVAKYLNWIQKTMDENQ
ncbi:hypothetical protein MHYP_G00026740 [Metynnis hypsauchen]